VESALRSKIVEPMKVLITGASGFLAKNLRLHLAERKDIEVVCFDRSNTLADLPKLLEDVAFVFHLAGVNRPQNTADFIIGNADFTAALVEAVEHQIHVQDRPIQIVFTSSTQAVCDNPYGASKRMAEDALRAFSIRSGAPATIIRLPNVFGKFCRPNYNSVIATFCHNIARDLPIQVNDPDARLTLVYVDDVVDHFLHLIDGGDPGLDDQGFSSVKTQYTATVGEIARWLQLFRASRESLMSQQVGEGLMRALYSTYVSYLPVDSFSYALPLHGDSRGHFVEMLKTPDCGQFSYFTAHPGITRGGHYHHTKTEKFLVIKGDARFRFRHMLSDETYERITSGARPEIVETVPGWAHDITNIGSEEMLVMLWANETFDRSRPDTYPSPL